MLKLFTRPLFNFLIGVAVGIATNYYVDLVYFEMRAEGLTPSLPYFESTEEGYAVSTEVYLVPFEGMSFESAGILANHLSGDLGIRVIATGAIPLPEEGFDEVRKQFISEHLANEVRKVATNLRKNNKQLFIGILKNDMYSSRVAWNYSMTNSFDGKISLVAGERLVPHGVLDRPEAEKIYGRRFYKLLKRIIGLDYYGYSRTEDRSTILYSPIMSITDLDEIGMSY